MGRRYRSFTTFSPNDSNTICDVTGFKVKISQVVKRWEGFMVIPEAWHPRQPQDFPIIPVPQQTFPVRTQIDTPAAAAPCGADLVWAQQTSVTVFGLNSIWYSNGVWVTVGDQGKIFTSHDNGITWIERTSGTTQALNAVHFWNGNWWIGGDEINSNPATALKSADAITWTSIAAGFTFSEFVSIDSNADTMVFLVRDKQDVLPYTKSTTDGVTFTEYDLPQNFPSGISDPINIRWNDVDKLWGVVGLSTNSDEWFGTSPDLINWTPIDVSPGGTGNKIFGLDYDGTNWIVAASPTLIYTSPDSLTWTQRPESIMGADTNSNISNDGVCTILLCGGNNSGNGKIIQSIDNGATWKLSYAADSGVRHMNDTHYGNGTWIAVGDSGRIITGVPVVTPEFEII